MFKKTIIEDRQQKEIDIDFNTFINEVEVFLKNNKFNLAVIQNICPMGNKGISMTLTNKIYGDMSNVLILNDLGVYLLEFKEFSNAIAITDKANITIDKSLNRIYLNDFGIKIQFMYS